MTLRLACDTGGTFTDLVAFDEASNQLTFHKVSSTPDDPAEAIIQGIEGILSKLHAAPQDVSLLVHGTTIATNSILQRNGAKIALITTAGFRDVLHIQRQDRPRMYDLRSRRAPALVPRRLRLELRERMLFDGSVRTPVDHGELLQLIDTLRREEVEAVAVGLLHSYANPAHELEVGQVLAEHLPQVTVCLSHEVVGECGEYERFSTCAMNAFLQPVVRRYLSQLQQRLREIHLSSPLFVMKSNGGVMSGENAGRQSVETILSGPAGGVMAGAALAGLHGNRNLITADMGGTSFDVALIHEGRPTFARDSEIGGLALAVPMLDIHTVGAGGGSIAWVDAGGALRVGPQSAGAVPGPACYNRGGKLPTVTDANLVLGRLSSTSLLSGGMTLDLEQARGAIHDQLAKPLGLSIEQAAEGIVRVVNATMTAAIRKLTVERGFDPRDFMLCPFGGAGPLHGSELAAEMGIQGCLVPPAPGATSALGLLLSHLREDRVRTHVALLTPDVLPTVERILGELTADASSRLGFAGTRQRVHRRLGMRYLGQRYELSVPLADGPLYCSTIAARFHDEHQQAYGYCRPEEAVELVTVWVSVEAETQPIPLARAAERSGRAVPNSVRGVVFRGVSYETPIFRREDLGPAAALQGPAVIEQLDSTTLVWPEQQLRVDDFGQIVLGPISD